MSICYDCNQLTSGRCPQHNRELPYPQHAGDQYANLVARVAELERRLTALQTAVDGLRLDGIKTDQRLDAHVQAQADVHGLTAGATAERLDRLEVIYGDEIDVRLATLEALYREQARALRALRRNPPILTDSQCERIAAAVLRVFESGVPEDEEGRSLFYPAIRDAAGAYPGEEKP